MSTNSFGLECAHCASSDLSGTKIDDTIEVVCQACGHQWLRTPADVCRYCGSTDVETTSRDTTKWYAAQEETWTAEEIVRHCRKCRRSSQETRWLDPVYGYWSREDFAAMTVVELREQALNWGLDATAMHKKELIQMLVIESANEIWTRAQLERMPTAELRKLANSFDVTTKGRPISHLVNQILKKQQDGE